MGFTISRGTLRTAGIALLALYVLAGCVYSFVLPPQARFYDEGEYLTLSDHLQHGPGYSEDGIHLTASRPPGYAFFLYAFQSLGASVSGLRLIQFLLLGATMFMVYRLCPKELRPTTLFIITLLVIIYPVLFYTSALLYPQTVAGFLFILALTQLLSPAKCIVANFATGLTFGFLILAVPTFLFTLGVVLAVALWLSMIRWRDGLIILIGASLLVGVWTARNYVQFHQFVPVASNSGANLLIGNCENTIPYGGSGNVDRTHYREEAQARGLDEFQEDRYYRQAAIDWIKNNPVRATILYFEKAANFFNVYNAYAPENKAEVSFWKQAVMAVSYGILLALLAWRLMEMKRFPLTTQEKLFLATYVLSAFTMAIFVTRIRYRLPYDFLIIAVIATHLARRLDLWVGRTKDSSPS